MTANWVQMPVPVTTHMAEAHEGHLEKALSTILGLAGVPGMRYTQADGPLAAASEFCVIKFHGSHGDLSKITGEVLLHWEVFDAGAR